MRILASRDSSAAEDVQSVTLYQDPEGVMTSPKAPYFKLPMLPWGSGRYRLQIAPVWPRSRVQVAPSARSKLLYLR